MSINFHRITKKLKSTLKWLYPGMRVKRWLLLTPLGVFFVLVGVTLLWNVAVVDYLNSVAHFVAVQSDGTIDLSQIKVYLPISIASVILGLVLMFISIRQVVNSIASVISPSHKDNLADVIYQRRYLAQGYRIVVIGGGTGLSTMLRGLKAYTSNIVAVVTVTDDGGSSGLLNRQLGMLPPGDIRNCLVALADEETLMTELFQHRFENAEEGLKGHSFGNLLIAAMTNITGEFEEAIKETSKVLAIRGNVFPSTTQTVKLCAQMDDDQIVEGECNIAADSRQIKHITLIPSDVQPLDEVLEAISLADAIIIGPGSVYTSIIPNLLVDRMSDTICESEAVKIYVCNVMTQPGETDHYRASDHVKAVVDHSGKHIFDYVLLNKEFPSSDLLNRYCDFGSELVSPDAGTIKEMGYIPVLGDYISQTDVVRHDPGKLAQAILKLVYEKAFISK
ncbi:MAG: gluconeogenesis factor YvcK family protein [Armatimonadota bacterium]